MWHDRGPVQLDGETGWHGVRQRGLVTHAQACGLWVLGPEIPRVLAVAQDVYYGDVERGDVRV
jgi:hypothetical protein